LQKELSYCQVGTVLSALISERRRQKSQNEDVRHVYFITNLENSFVIKASAHSLIESLVFSNS
jgi:hypothetical protein